MSGHPPSTCPVCGGDGYIDGKLCRTCMGGGSIPIVGINGYFKEVFEDLTDKVNDITDKVNDILEVIQNP